MEKQTGHAGLRLSIGQGRQTENHREARDATTLKYLFIYLFGCAK